MEKGMAQEVKEIPVINSEHQTGPMWNNKVALALSNCQEKERAADGAAAAANDDESSAQHIWLSRRDPTSLKVDPSCFLLKENFLEKPGA